MCNTKCKKQTRRHQACYNFSQSLSFLKLPGFEKEIRAASNFLLKKPDLP